tara:strand:+ start:24486 stop:26222 length:1737 start_codon:yes stop_codon:yes gene_type:complete
VNKQILSLISAYRGKLSTETFTEILAACMAWLKLSSNGKLDDEHDFKGTASKELLAKVLNNCVDVHFSSEKWDIDDAQLTKLLNSLLELIKANVVSYTELSEVIKHLHYSEGKNSSLFTVPVELAELGAKLIGDNTQSVYCPFLGGSDFAMQWPKAVEKCGESLVGSEVFFAEVHSILLENKFDTVNANPIYTPYYIGDGGLKQFDASIAMPPIGMKLQVDKINDIWGRFPEKSLMGEVYFLRHMLAQTSNTVVCFVANGFLFRTAAGEKQFKQDVVNQNWVKAVIALPNNLLSNTSISISILVLDKNKNDTKVKFIDASSDIFTDKSSRTRNRLVNIDKILEAYSSIEASDISSNAVPGQLIENDYNLSPNRYVFSDESKEVKEYLRQFKTAKLEDLVDIIRPQAVKHVEDGVENFYEFNLSNLDDVGFVSGEGKQICVSQNDISKANKQAIKANDVLVVCKGAVGKIGFADGNIGDNAIASQAFSILRVKPYVKEITAEALYQYLTSKYGQQLLVELATGTSALMLSAKDLNTLDVPLYPAEKLDEISEVRQKVINIFQQIEGLKSDVKQLNESWL